MKKHQGEFGSSTIVVSIEAIKHPNGEYFCYIDNGREYIGVNVIDWAKQIEEMGAGEVVITSVDNEGTGKGFDIDLIGSITDLLSIPVIAHGGAGKKEDINDVIRNGKADAVAVSSILHYEAIEKVVSMGDYSDEGNTEFLRKRIGASKFNACTIDDIKQSMLKDSIMCRHNISRR